MAEGFICVEVAYALPHKQKLLTVEVPRGTTMFEAAEQSGITQHFPDLELSRSAMGIFGKLEANPKTRVMQPGERVEIYRPLTADPKENRKARAQQAKAKKAAK